MPLPGTRAFTQRGGASLLRMWLQREISSVPKWGYSCLRPGVSPLEPRGPPFPVSTMTIFEIVPKCKRTRQNLWASSLRPSSRNPVSLRPLLFLDSLARSLQAGGRAGGSSRRESASHKPHFRALLRQGASTPPPTTRWVSQASQLQVSSFRLGCTGKTATLPASSTHQARLARSPDTPEAS